MLASVGTGSIVGGIPVVGSIPTSTVVLGVTVTVVSCACSSTRTLAEGTASTCVTTVGTSVLRSHHCVLAEHPLVAVAEVLSVAVGVTVVSTAVEDASSASCADVARRAGCRRCIAVAVSCCIAAVPVGARAVVGSAFDAACTLTVGVCSTHIASVLAVVAIGVGATC